MSNVDGDVEVVVVVDEEMGAPGVVKVTDAVVVGGGSVVGVSFDGESTGTGILLEEKRQRRGKGQSTRR